MLEYILNVNLTNTIITVIITVSLIQLLQL